MNAFNINRGAAIAAALTVAGTVLLANDVRFSDFTPLTASAGQAADESRPITLSNPDFEQTSVANRFDQIGRGIPNSGNWDMLTTNETGPHKGRYLFTVFETGHSGVQRMDVETGVTETIWHSPVAGQHVAFDASYWTPWGTFITAEESWCSSATGCTTSPYGRLFELKNPLTAPPIVDPLTPWSNVYADFVHRNVIPRTSHEGIQFDQNLNMYFIDELNGGAIYRFTSAASWGEIMSGRAEYFAAGQTSVLRVGSGTVANATGQFTWVPLTNTVGVPLPGTITITDPNGIVSLDARSTADLPAFRGTDYQRPEDLQIQKVRNGEILYVTTTTTHEVYAINLATQTISVFANRNTIDLATRLAVGSGLANPDNLAIDHEGNIYIVEDRGGAVDDDNLVCT